MTATIAGPEPVSVTAWGELPAERKLRRCLRVLVAGQAAGGAERAWLTAGTPERARKFARNSAIGALVLGMLG